MSLYELAMRGRPVVASVVVGRLKSLVVVYHPVNWRFWHERIDV